MNYKKVLSIVFVIGIFLYLLWNIFSQWNEIISFHWNINIFNIIILLLLMLAMYLINIYCWHLIVKAFGFNLNFPENARIWILSSLSRYIPGTIWQYIGRVELSHRAGVPRIITTTALLYEMLLTLTAGLFVGLVSVFFLDLQKIKHLYWLPILFIPLILLHPYVFSKSALLIAKITKKETSVGKLPLSSKQIFFIFPWFVVNFLISGIALAILVYSLGIKINVVSILMFSGFYALSWVLGFISIFAPGGFGITEASLAFFLSFSMPFAVASLIALLYRFFLTIAELLLLTFILKFKKNKS